MTDIVLEEDGIGGASSYGRKGQSWQHLYEVYRGWEPLCGGWGHTMEAGATLWRLGPHYGGWGHTMEAWSHYGGWSHSMEAGPTWTTTRGAQPDTGGTTRHGGHNPKSARLQWTACPPSLPGSSEWRCTEGT